MDDLVIVGKWCKFRRCDFRGLVWYPFPRGNIVGYVWHLYLADIPGGYIELNDTCGRAVWEAVGDE